MSDPWKVLRRLGAGGTAELFAVRSPRGQLAIEKRLFAHFARDPTASALFAHEARVLSALRGVQGWPGYRMTGGVMLTSQWRMNDCFRQQRFPEPNYASQAVTNLIAYMTGNANGQMYKGPGIKR